MATIVATTIKEEERKKVETRDWESERERESGKIPMALV